MAASAVEDQSADLNETTNTQNILPKALEINFGSGSAEISSAYETTIQKFADELKKESFKRIEIQGHTDSLGDQALNQRLSEERASAIREKLISYGVDGEKLAAVGLGSSQPVTENNTPQNRALNRRITVEIE